VDDRVKEGR
jgi:hypothetical protein